MGARQGGGLHYLSARNFRFMFDTIKCLWLGFSGRLSHEKESRKMIWLLLASFLAGWLATLFAAWVSFPAYRAMIDFLPDAEMIAAAFTFGIAFFIYFDLAYVGGFLVERWKAVPGHLQTYTALGFRILFLAGIIFLVADFYMNKTGATYRADEAGGEMISFHYTTPQAVVAQLKQDRERLQGIENGTIGGYGWQDEAGRWRLNRTGKKMAADLRQSIRRTEQKDSTLQARHILDVTRENTRLEQIKHKAGKTLRNGVYGVYVFIFLLCIIQAYIVETIQAASPDGHFQNEPPKPAAAGKRKTESIANKARGIFTPSAAGVVAESGGYKITCKNCGTEAFKKSNRAVFCSDACRVEYWEREKGAKVKKGKTKKPQKIGFQK